MWLIGVEAEQETSAPPPKKILDPPLGLKILFETFPSLQSSFSNTALVSTELVR